MFIYSTFKKFPVLLKGKFYCQAILKLPLYDLQKSII